MKITKRLREKMNKAQGLYSDNVPESAVYAWHPGPLGGPDWWRVCDAEGDVLMRSDRWPNDPMWRILREEEAKQKVGVL